MGGAKAKFIGEKLMIYRPTSCFLLLMIPRLAIEQKEILIGQVITAWL